MLITMPRCVFEENLGASVFHKKKIKNCVCMVFVLGERNEKADMKLRFHIGCVIWKIALRPI